MKVEEIKIALQKNREVHLEFASIDKFKSEYSKLKNINPVVYINQISSIRKELLKGIEDAGNFSDRIKKVLTGLRELGLNDEAKPFEDLKRSIDEDFKELVSINDKIK